VISDQSSFLDLDFEDTCLDFEDEEWWEERWEEDISVSVEEDS